MPWKSWLRRPDGRFTTVELLQTITNEAPGFPKDQTPVISDRQHNAEAGRIVLHPLPKDGSSTQVTAKENANTDPAERHTVTLHLDFSDKPLKDNIKKLGTELNTVFERHCLGLTGFAGVVFSAKEPPLFVTRGVLLRA